MHSAIVAVELPNDIEQQKWLAFLATIDRLRNDAAVQRIADNVWQVNFENSPASFAQLVSAAEHHGLVYRILQLDAEPQWRPVGFGPKTT